MTVVQILNIYRKNEDVIVSENGEELGRLDYFDYLDKEPVAFSLSDRPGTIMIYMDWSHC